MSKKKNEYAEIGERIRSFRVRNGITQKEAADDLRVTPGYISNMENNRTAISLRVLSYYAKRTGTTLDVLLGNEEETYVQTALDRQLQEMISGLSDDQKEMLLETIRIWTG